MAYNILNLIPKVIQDALGLKANINSPTFTGNVTLPSGTTIGNVSALEISYLDNATGNLQSQIDAKQGSDADLTAISALSSSGILVRSGANTWTLRGLDAPAAGLTITNSSGIGGNPAFAFANDLLALENLSSTGLAVRTGTDSWAQRGLVGPSEGFTISNANGVAGNPTFTLSNDLLAVESLTSSGIAVRSGVDTWVVRSLVAPAAGITITNSSGINGNPTFALANDLLALENLGSVGIAIRTATDTWAQRQITVNGPLIVSNGDGVAGNPLLNISGATSGSSGVVPGIDGTATGNVTSINRLDIAFSASGSGIALTHSGNDLIINLPTFSHAHNAIVNITGVSGLSGIGGNRNIILNPTGLTTGTTLDLLFNIAPIANMNVLISGNGVLLDSFVTDNSADRARARFVLTNNWQYFGGSYPA